MLYAILIQPFQYIDPETELYDTHMYSYVLICTHMYSHVLTYVNKMCLHLYWYFLENVILINLCMQKCFQLSQLLL